MGQLLLVATNHDTWPLVLLELTADAAAAESSSAASLKSLQIAGVKQINSYLAHSDGQQPWPVALVSAVMYGDAWQILPATDTPFRLSVFRKRERNRGKVSVRGYYYCFCCRGLCRLPALE